MTLSTIRKISAMKLVRGTVFELDSIGSDGDHAHFFIGAGTKYFPSKVMQIMKNITTRRTFREYSEIETQLWDYELSIDIESTLELGLWHNL
jgi:hypothetical protein